MSRSPLAIEALIPTWVYVENGEISEVSRSPLAIEALIPTIGGIGAFVFLVSRSPLAIEALIPT